MNRRKKYLQKGLIETEMEKEILPRCVYPAVSHRLTLHCWSHWIPCLCYCFETTLTPNLALKICFAYKLQGIMSSFEHSSAIVFRTDLSKLLQGALTMWWVGKLTDNSLQVLQTPLGHENKQCWKYHRAEKFTLFGEINQNKITY